LVRWALSLASTPTPESTPTHDHPGEGRGPAGKVALTTRCPALPPFPNWAPAFAGVAPSPCGRLVLYRQLASCRPHPLHLPGGGRGPGGKVAVTTHCPSLPSSPNWAPAFAGVVVGWWGGVLATHVELFPREGGDPDWAPAFAGEQGRAAYGEQGRDTSTRAADARGHCIAGAG